MQVMSCFGDRYNINDRMCEMCRIACEKQYDYCKELLKIKNSLTIISDGCVYLKKQFSYSERDYDYLCNKFGGYCEPHKKCEKDEIDKHNSLLENRKSEMIEELNKI